MVYKIYSQKPCNIFCLKVIFTATKATGYTTNNFCLFVFDSSKLRIESSVLFERFYNFDASNGKSNLSKYERGYNL